MVKLKKFGQNILAFHCPGCGDIHQVRVADHAPYKTEGNCWGWNGDMEHPTFSPSIRVNGVAGCRNPGVPLCHSFVTDGVIYFLGDCEHGMRGMPVVLPEFL